MTPVDPTVDATHLQAYLGREPVPMQTLRPRDYRKNSEDPLVIQLPIEDFISDKGETESFKQLSVLTIDKRLTNYTAFCKVFMIFANEKKVNIQKSQVLKAFHMVNSVKKFLDLKLPLRKFTLSSGAASTDLT